MKKIAYINKRVFYEGQILDLYDYKGSYLYKIKINKFIVHYKRNTKKPYLCVNISRSCYKEKTTHDITYLTKFTK